MTTIVGVDAALHIGALARHPTPLSRWAPAVKHSAFGSAHHRQGEDGGPLASYGRRVGEAGGSRKRLRRARWSRLRRAQRQSLATSFPSYLPLNPLAIPVAELPFLEDLSTYPKRARRPPAKSVECMFLDGHELLVREYMIETSEAAEDPGLPLTLNDVALHRQAPVASTGLDRRLVLLLQDKNVDRKRRAPASPRPKGPVPRLVRTRTRPSRRRR